MNRHAAAVLVLVGLLSACSSGGEPGPRDDSATPATSTPDASSPTPSPEAEAGGAWRTEVWRDVQLEVPPSWQPGYAPLPRPGGAALCGIGALGEEEPRRTPYVGRPGYGSDLCLVVDEQDLVPDPESVWFGSPLPVGETLAKDGTRSVTVAVGDSRVTVTSRQRAVVDRAIASVEEVPGRDGNGCPARPRLQRGWPVEGYGDPLSLSVCLYDEASRREWSDRLPARSASDLLEAVEAGTEARCRPEGETGQLLLLRVWAKDPFGTAPLERDLTVSLGACAVLEPAVRFSGPSLRLTADLVEPWAGPGVRTYVIDPPGGSEALGEYFRPVWG